LKKAKPHAQTDIRFPKRELHTTEALLEKHTRILEELLVKGDFYRANEEFERLLKSVDYQKLPFSNPWRAKATAIATWLHFYRGDNPAAYQALSEYVANEKLFLDMPELRTGQKLVLAEYVYSRGEFERAIKMADRILAECEVKGDLSGMGEICHFMSRCHRRLHQYEEFRSYCDRAREYFLQHYLSTENVLQPKELQKNIKILRWQIGLSCQIEGYSLWNRGDIVDARHRLVTAKSLLKNTGDYINEANVFQSLGCITRSEGDYDASLESLNRALRLYSEIGHHLNKSRALTNIGRTYLRRADQHSDDWEKARETLEEALEICNSHDLLRQKGEVLVILSWLYLHRGDPNRAEAYASAALKEAKAVNSPGLQTEARISIGYCRYKKNDESAIGELKAALQYAKTLKLQISAHLALAEVFSGRNNILDAVQHLLDAERLLGPKPNASNVYLSQKFESVRKQMDALKNDYFLVTFEAITDQAMAKSRPKGLAKATKDLERWAIVKAVEQSSENMTKAAGMLGLARQAFWQRKKRAQPK
jgi:tetratricopeptide (TPR) repeat protein